MRKVNAGVIQGEALFVGAAGSPAGVLECCSFGRRWSG
jgi:hypothetical protein